MILTIECPKCHRHNVAYQGRIAKSQIVALKCYGCGHVWMDSEDGLPHSVESIVATLEYYG